MQKVLIVVALVLSAVVLSACGADRYSVEVGPVATAVPTAAPVPTQAPQIIIVQAPAPAQPVQPAPSPASDNAMPFILLGALAACVVFLTMLTLAWIMVPPSRPAPRTEPYPPFVEATYIKPPPIEEGTIPLLNVTNHYHYHAAGDGADTRASGWSVGRRVNELLAQGLSVDEARSILDSEHRAQLPPPAK